MNLVKEQLNLQGYAVLESGIDVVELDSIKTEAEEWLSIVAPTIPPHGVIKFYEVAHQAFMWRIRTHPKIIALFEALYETNGLVASFDGVGYIPPNLKRKDTNWLHSDQRPSDCGFKCFQGAVALTSNEARTFQCVPQSHLKLQGYYQKYPPKDASRFQKAPHFLEYDATSEATTVPLKMGQILIWDSRLLHQNVYGAGCGEKRLVAYVSYLPRRGCSATQKSKRLKYFETRRATSHWAYPVAVSGLQPQVWGNSALLINYASLPPIAYDPYLFQEIMKLI